MRLNIQLRRIFYIREQIREGVKGQTPAATNTTQPPPVTVNDTLEQTQVREASPPPVQSIEEIVGEEPEMPPDYQPFAKNEAKQKRYNLYLRMKEKGLKGTIRYCNKIIYLYVRD